MNIFQFYSPYINRFLSPDTIVPGAGNPQAFNRYAYTLNNPIRYNDPTGHVCSDPEDLTPSCDGSSLQSAKVGDKVVQGSGLNAGKPKTKKPKGGGNGGLPDSDGYNSGIKDILETIKHDDFQALEDNGCFTQGPGTIDWTNSKCVDAISFAFQDIATLSSSLSASWTASLTTLGCVAAGLTEGISCAAGYGFGLEAHIVFFNPLESFASGSSFALTVWSDYLTHDTYFNSLTDWGVGEDTLTGLATFAAGSIVVEPFTDAGIDIYSSGYNHGYFCGISTVVSCLGR